MEQWGAAAALGYLLEEIQAFDASGDPNGPIQTNSKVVNCEPERMSCRELIGFPEEQIAINRSLERFPSSYIQ
jgi:hypothetical protein